MAKITHLWNVNQFITSLNCTQSTTLQTFYMQKCRNLSEGTQLPQENFGPSVMCLYCGCLWNTVDHSIRILRGKSLSKSFKKVVHCMDHNDKRIPKVRRKLAQKCVKNKMNKLVLKCSVCSKSTQIPFNKPPREKIQKPTESRENIQSCHKRRKRRTKDKTAGLNISGVMGTSIEDIVEGPKETNAKNVASASKFITPTQKIKKLNINRLRDMVNQDSTPPKRRSLHNFLTELC